MKSAIEAAPTPALVELRAVLPDVATGVRAAVTTVLPFALAVVSARPELSWMALGGWLGTMVDPGGARSVRARTVAAFAWVGAAVVALSEAFGPSPVAPSLVLAVVAFLGALLGALGAEAESLGRVVTIVAAVAVARPSLHVARDATWFAAGAGVALVLSSIVWPIWTHLPVRRAVASVLAELEQYARALERCMRREEGTSWSEVAQNHPRRVRAALEAARAMSLAIHVRRDGETVTGSNLRVILGMAESQFLLLVTLGAELETADAIPAAAAPAARSWADTWRAARQVLVAHASGPLPEPLAIPGAPGHVAALGEELRQEAAALLDVARSLAVKQAERLSTPVAPPSTPVARTRVLEDALSRRSPVLRHAVRIMVGVLAASAIGAWLSPDYAAWVTLTTVVVLQPHRSATLRRAVERVLGTVLGGVVAAAITLLRLGPLGMAALMFPLSVAAMVTRPRSYSMFTFFLTPVFVLVAMGTSGDARVALVRAGDTVLGGGVALVVALLLFPRWETDVALPDAVATMRSALGAYVALVTTTSTPRNEGAIRESRRTAALAIADAELSVERVLADPTKQARRRAGEMAGMVELVTYARSLVLAATALDTLASRAAGNAAPTDAARERVARFSRLFRRVDDALGSRPE